MMDKKRIGNRADGKITFSGRLFTAIAAVWLAFGLSGCSSKEAVLLEDELVLETGIPDGRAGMQGQERTESAAGMEAGAGMNAASDGAGAFPGETGTEAAGTGDMRQAEASSLFVHICGEVAVPGVYELPVGSRIFEAVEAAGGFTEKASAGYVNLALELADGWKVEIPALGEEPGSGRSGAPEQDAGNGTVTKSMAGITGSGAGITGGNGSTAEETGGLVDINIAGKQELCTLPGVGESRAESIIAYREKNGGFERIEDIMKVEGIKEGMFSKMKDKICVGK